MKTIWKFKRMAVTAIASVGIGFVVGSLAGWLGLDSSGKSGVTFLVSFGVASYLSAVWPCWEFHD